MSIDIITLTASKNYTDKQIEKASIKGADLSRYVQSVNGIAPDENGNVVVEGGGAWKYAGKFTTREHVNPFTITQDEKGNPLSFTELFLRVNLRWFHLSSNSSANRGIDLLGDDGKWYGTNLNNVTALKLTKAETIEGVEVLETDVSPIQIEKIGDAYYVSRVAVDPYNNATAGVFTVMGNKSTPCVGVNKFMGFRFSMGFATNLVVAGSNVEVYYR